LGPGADHRRLLAAAGDTDAVKRREYPFTTRDADGNFLNGSSTYKLYLPPHPPAALFWAVTAYNITDGTMAEAPQLLPSINAFNDVTINSDGSVDLWLGPQKPANAPDSNWI
jgi:hypothetical protein